MDCLSVTGELLIFKGRGRCVPIRGCWLSEEICIITGHLRAALDLQSGLRS